MVPNEGGTEGGREGGREGATEGTGNGIAIDDDRGMRGHHRAVTGRLLTDARARVWQCCRTPKRPRSDGPTVQIYTSHKEWSDPVENSRVTPIFIQLLFCALGKDL